MKPACARTFRHVIRLRSPRVKVFEISCEFCPFFLHVPAWLLQQRSSFIRIAVPAAYNFDLTAADGSAGMSPAAHISLFKNNS